MTTVAQDKSNPVLSLRWESGEFFILDQTRLPAEVTEIRMESSAQVWEAIKQLRVRGAPAIGIAGAYGLLVGLMAWMSVRLFRKGMSEPPEANSLAFTFLGIIIAIFISLVTVYLGENVVPAFFLMLGWAEAYIHGRGGAGISGATELVQPARGFRFRRVIR